MENGNPPTPGCIFRRVATGYGAAVVLNEDSGLLASFGVAPIRSTDSKIMPKWHVETFELPSTRLEAGRAELRPARKKLGLSTAPERSE